MVRTPREIAERAIVYGALGSRASLEVTVHPRSAEISSRLLPWLERIGLGEQIEEFHREILETAYGQMPKDHLTEAYWRGDSAALLGWAIQLLDLPDRQRTVDPGDLFDRLKLLRSEAMELLNGATLRLAPEINEFCAFCWAVRSRYQQAVLDEAGARTLERINRQRMSELGLLDLDRAFEQAAIFTMSTDPPLRGLYVARAIAAAWLLGKDFDDD